MFAAFAALTLVCGLAFETHILPLSDNRVANEIAANGASSFFRALRTNEIDYHTYYASRSDARPTCATSSRSSGDTAGSSRASPKAGSIAVSPPIPTGWAS